MAITTRYFSTASAGVGDGTTWANRAALLDGSGYLSSIITGFDFTSNALFCHVGPGTYTLGQSLTNTLFTKPMTTLTPLFLHGCDSNGNLLQPKNTAWKSSMAPWSSDGIPYLNFGSLYLSSLTNTFYYHINASGSRNGYVLTSITYAEWCKFYQTGSGTASYIAGTIQPILNCVFDSTGATGYQAIMQPAAPLYNCKIIGPGPSVGSGTRAGISAATFYDIVNCHVTGVGGHGIRLPATANSRRCSMFNNTITNCGGDGISMENTISPVTARSDISRCIITGCGGYGINANSTIITSVNSCRLRDNTSGNINGIGNFRTDLNNNETAGSDTNEYTAPSLYDYSIKPTSYLWGKGYGAGDAPNLQRFLQRLRA